MIIMKAAGGVVIQNNHRPDAKVLLIKRCGVWDLPKGKIDAGESPTEAAIREVKEETGVNNLILLKFLCDTYHEYTQDKQTIGKVTFWYIMKCANKKNTLQPQVEEDITDVKWVKLSEAISLLHYDNLKEVLSKCKEESL